MPIACVIASKKDSLLSLAMTSLIDASGFDLSAVKIEANDPDELMHEIGNKDINVILLENSSPIIGGNFFPRLLQAYPELIVILINEDNNWLQIYRREEKLMTSSTDLITAITSIWNEPKRSERRNRASV